LSGPLKEDPTKQTTLPIRRLPDLSINNEVPKHPKLRYNFKSRQALPTDLVWALYTTLALAATPKAQQKETELLTVKEALRDPNSKN
jgi:hypothetical protein